MNRQLTFLLPLAHSTGVHPQGLEPLFLPSLGISPDSRYVYASAEKGVIYRGRIQ